MKTIVLDAAKIRENPSDEWASLTAMKGESAYEIAVRRGYQGTEQQWLSALETEMAAAVASIETRGDQTLASIEAMGDHTLASIETKGTQTLASIPNDYTTLSGEVSRISDEFKNNVADAGVFYNDGVITLTASDMVSGSWAYGAPAENSKRLRTSRLIPVKAGMFIKYTNPTLQIYFGVARSTTETTAQNLVQNSNWINAGGRSAVYKITQDGYLYIIVQSANDITTEDYDCDVEIISGLGFAKSDIDGIKAVMTKSGMAILKHKAISNNTYEETDAYNYKRVFFDWKYYGTVLKITVKRGYSLLVYRTGAPVMEISATDADVMRFLNAFSGTQWCFVARKQDNDELISFEEALSNVSIEECHHKTEEVFNGMYKEVVEISPNSTLSGTLQYTYASDTGTSAPIEIPKSGLLITQNYVKSMAGTRKTFRVTFVKMTENGFVQYDDDEDFAAANTTPTHTSTPVYIPYKENGVYAIVRLAYGDNADDVIWAYTGEIKSGGKLLGLSPMRAYLTNGGSPVIIRDDSKDDVQNTTNYYGGFMWLKYARCIVANPKYSILANIYELNPDNTVTLRDSIYTYQFTGGRIYGVQYVDLTKYDFNGFVRYAIYCGEEFRARGLTGQSFKTPVGMGVMARYNDVFSNVYVDYYNNYQVTVEPGMPSILFDNLNKFMSYTYPLRLGSRYVHEWEKNANGHDFPETENTTPAFYGGSYDENVVLISVTGRSYYTAMANINSRCYQFTWNDNSYGRKGYGITCTDFVSIVQGLRENYPISSIVYDNDLYKYEKIKDDWDYTKDMDLLKPGDVLGKLIVLDHEGEGVGEYINGHLMIVTEKKYVNGQLEAVTVAEAGYPYTRFMTMYNSKYDPVTYQGSTSMRRLAEYTHVARLKPQYLKKIDEVFDLSRDYTPGTVMCDRGNCSIYTVNPVDGANPSGAKELGAPNLILTITDDTASSISIFRDGTLVDTVSIGNDTMNDKRILDIKQYVTQGGLYTIKTNTSNDVQETFWVQEPFSFSRLNIESETHTLKVDNLSSLVSAVIAYRKSLGVVDGEERFQTLYRLYVPEEFEPVETTKGTVEYPATFEGGTYSFTKLNYTTEYGSYSIRVMPKNGTLCVCASVEYAFEKY